MQIIPLHTVDKYTDQLDLCDSFMPVLSPVGPIFLVVLKSSSINHIVDIFLVNIKWSDLSLASLRKDEKGCVHLDLVSTTKGKNRLEELWTQLEKHFEDDLLFMRLDDQNEKPIRIGADEYTAYTPVK